MKRWTIRALNFLLTLTLLATTGCSDDSAGQDDAAVDAAPQSDGGDAGTTALSLELGELLTVDADASGLAQITLATPEGVEEFIVMVHSRASTVNSLRAYTAGMPQAKLGTPPASSDTMLRRWGCLSAGGQVDLRDVVARLRDRPSARRPPGRRPPLPVPPPNPGELVSFEIGTSTGIVTVQSEVLLVSASLVIAIDRDTDPTLELDATTLDEIATGFEDIVLPRERIFFGDESDVNDDGHVTLLFSPLVYESGATAYVNPWDLITDPLVRPSNVAGNDQELIYITPPQLLEPYMATPRAILETVAHEFQHAIYFYRKYMLNATVGEPESAYITEGLSALAQDLTGYQAGNFFVSMAALNDINDVSVNDLVGSGGYYIYERDGALRGSGYLLLRYLYDQAGGDTVLPNGDIDVAGSPGIGWLRDFVDSPELGVASIEAATGQTVAQAAADWYIAMMVDDRTDDQSQPLNTDPRYNYLPTATDPLTDRTRGTSMFESFGTAHKTGPLVQEITAADGGIRIGGVEYLHLVATSTDVTAVTIAADPQDVDIGIVIFRIR
ncbi:MAG: hypothetical protein ABI333_23825 [bacterium]